ncbi:MAG TPA: serine/threonine-protein kinase [Streptosporangiaceae bacterium]|nr:serine/threonine-protein kinase [Streptosporangiaceae bacterium]
MSAELSEGQTFGGYHIIGLVGSGGMGLVYRAEQRILGRTVALKVIRPEIAESGDYRSRFLREARFAAAVDHPNVVPVFDAGEQDGRLYLTMQWIDGRDLGTILNHEQRLAPDRVVRIGIQLAGALQAVNDAGLVHRDVKPSNVLVRDIGGSDHAYLTDFGIAKAPAAQDSLTRTGWVIGTPGYLSPEQIRGDQPSSRSDLYALGCIVFEALTGERPFSGDNDLAVRWAQASGPPPVASSVWPALGTRYDAFLAKAMAVDPRDRFQSGAAFAEALQAAHAGQPVPLTQAPAARDAWAGQAPRPAPGPPPVSGTWPDTAVSPPGALDPTVPPPVRPRPAARTPRPVTPTPPPARPAPRAAGVPTPATAPVSGPGRTAAPPGAGPGARPSGAGPGVRPSGAGSRARPSGALRAGQLVAVIGGLVSLASGTVLTHYVNNGTGWKSLWQATHGDLASPLYQIDFWIPAGLAVLALAFTAISAILRKRLPMIGTTLASVGLIVYTLRIPSKGSHPGFGPYGSSYWLSVAACFTVLIGAAIALAARSRARGPQRSPGTTRPGPPR